MYSPKALLCKIITALQTMLIYLLQENGQFCSRLFNKGKGKVILLQTRYSPEGG